MCTCVCPPHVAAPGCPHHPKTFWAHWPEDAHTEHHHQAPQICLGQDPASGCTQGQPRPCCSPPGLPIPPPMGSIEAAPGHRAGGRSPRPGCAPVSTPRALLQPFNTCQVPTLHILFFFFHLSGWNLGAERTWGPGAPVLGLQGLSRSRRAATAPYPHLVWGHRPQTLAAKWPEGCGGGILRVLLTPSPVCRQMGCFNLAPYGSDPGTPPQKKMGWGNTRARQRGRCEGDFNAQPHGTRLGSSFPSLLHRSHPWVLFSVKVGGGDIPFTPPPKVTSLYSAAAAYCSAPSGPVSPLGTSPGTRAGGGR